MKNDSPAPRRYTPEDISGWVRRYRAGSQSLGDFAAQHGLSRNRLHYWVYGRHPAPAPKSLGVRPSVVGRKRWLFIGHPEAGWRSAMIYTITQSCRRRGINPQECLADLLGRLPSMKNHDVKDRAAQSLESQCPRSHASAQSRWSLSQSRFDSTALFLTLSSSNSEPLRCLLQRRWFKLWPAASTDFLGHFLECKRLRAAAKDSGLRSDLLRIFKYCFMLDWVRPRPAAHFYHPTSSIVWVVEVVQCSQQIVNEIPSRIVSIAYLQR